MDNMESARNSVRVCTWFFWKRYDTDNTVTDLTRSFRHQSSIQDDHDRMDVESVSVFFGSGMIVMILISPGLPESRH